MENPIFVLQISNIFWWIWFTVMLVGGMSLAHSRNRVALGIFAVASVLAIISLIV